MAVAELSKIDTGSETWRVVAAWTSETRAAAAKAILEPSLDHPATNFWRGVISTLDMLESLPLTLATAPPPAVKTETPYSMTIE